MLTIEMDQEKAPSKERLSGALLVSIAEQIKAEVPTIPDGVVAAAFVSDQEIQDLNKKFRDKDKVTDVLSFSYVEDEDTESLGDVVISYDQAARQAKEGVKKELVTLLVHGILHVFGFDFIG